MPVMPSYTLNIIDFKNGNDVSLVELASALNYDGESWSIVYEETMDRGPIKFHGQFDLKKLGTGDVSSNLRYKHDKDRNNLVVRNTMEILYNISSRNWPVVITSYPREQRYKTFKLDPGGTIKVMNNGTSQEIVEDSLQMNEFIQKYITTVKFLEIRESTKGARYNSYLADMISFILMMNHHYHPEMFEEVVRKPCVFNTEKKSLVGKSPLRAFVKNGREWIPKKGFDYLYFEEVYNEKDGTRFSVPKDGSIGKVYHQLKDLLSLDENGMKEMLRKFMSEYGGYKRFSDYWVNDIDDGLTILLIKNAYSYCDLTDNDQKIVDEIDRIISENF